MQHGVSMLIFNMVSKHDILLLLLLTLRVLARARYSAATVTKMWYQQGHDILLLLLLTLRVSNQWLPSLHSLSLQNALSPCPQMTLKTSSPMSFVWLVMQLTPLLSQLYLVCLPPLGLWIPLVAII